MFVATMLNLDTGAEEAFGHPERTPKQAIDCAVQMMRWAQWTPIVVHIDDQDDDFDVRFVDQNGDEVILGVQRLTH